jgi:hypothetical protein
MVTGKKNNPTYSSAAKSDEELAEYLGLPVDELVSQA